MLFAIVEFMLVILSVAITKAVAKKAQKKIGASMGFEPMTTSVIPVRCSTNCQL